MRGSSTEVVNEHDGMPIVSIKPGGVVGEWRSVERGISSPLIIHRASLSESCLSIVEGDNEISGSFRPVELGKRVIKLGIASDDIGMLVYEISHLVPSKHRFLESFQIIPFTLSSGSSIFVGDGIGDTCVFLSGIGDSLSLRSSSALDMHCIAAQQLLRGVKPDSFRKLAVTLKVISTGFTNFLLVDEILHVLGFELEQFIGIVESKASVPEQRHSFCGTSDSWGGQSVTY